jgi:hypothetical protein
MKINFKKNIKNNEGFTLLFSVLVSTLVLSVGASIVTIALKQVVLSGTGRESQYAFYASNTGIECALYWDLAPGNTFSTSTPTSNPICLDNNILTEADTDYDFDSEGLVSAETEFNIQFNEIGPDDEIVQYCTDVSVTKERVNDSGRRRIATTILSRGYNTCDPNNPRRIERGLELNY